MACSGDASAQDRTFLPGEVSLKVESSLDPTTWTKIGFVQTPQAQPYRVYRADVQQAGGVVFSVSSETCPSINDALAALDDLELGSVDVPGIKSVAPRSTWHRPGGASTDGTLVSLSGRLRQSDGTSAGVVVSSNSGPLARWGEAAVATVMECWPDAR